MPKILFVASEAHPLIKTGGLGDVAGSLPAALQSRRADVRLLLPAYRDAVTRAGKLKTMATLTVPGLDSPVKIMEGRLPGTSVITWLADFPPAYDRPGHPYLDPRGQPWPDNAMRFALLAHVATALALGRTRIQWRPDVVHCHDWQTGLVPALLAREKSRPSTVFTIHNLSYQGLFPPQTFTALALAPELWSPEALEFHGRLSFIKGGLLFADQLTTVSPAYAREIQTPEFGDGLDGLLRRRAARLSGILNGIDDSEWDPARDRFIGKPYSARQPGNKAANKLALQREFGLPQETDTPLIGMVGRLVQQKGIDLILDTLPGLMHRPLQLVVLGSGETAYEVSLRKQVQRYPHRLAVRIGYDEGLAHRIEAGADMFLMPSRFEPCGLNQLYSLRYGTIPIVRRVGGLANTVVNATDENIKSGKATGIVFKDARAGALLAAVDRALALQKNTRCWKQMMHAGMRQDFSWRRSAAEYLRLYKQAARANGQRQDHEPGRKDAHVPGKSGKRTGPKP
ncbi:MAG: starch synthase [Candidatus Muproteobacteria bacterium RIFCSPHIGHO2_12_FULL_60_33]|uniref:Glycogen synthase n=1 Tax=Candidatus Muproteobacteria bacterium RIFCSPLOWO2_01_FULL_60_18 TaxID=1817768 RepID=A0A1F6U4W4_9PROT|nr:MAG: starch synthase [Candidatus Muproteobacteria bacterium RIFCSPHIGHO2_01_60_12]OGI52390.1 MAG: starch synthase [Candidatus Muproteobacteria bacterium RIFCSPLOWO2_01_FULL_60_18]OGI54767.1 MAG: starch synthase [Candidatus Muproteobacteria bacterium RIFCSPHIGHO2_02_FULL_60_13]OGI55790.1 MAG: starch synthase [Candidatus Muproteobacteria bacterium RIFCSPHIGHO2_12_FULL_60_33]